MTPKITNEQGSGFFCAGVVRPPCASGLRAAVCFGGSLWPPKPARIAERIFSANVCSLRERKRAIERRGQHLGRHRLVDRGIDGPAAFAGILDKAGIFIQRLVLAPAPTTVRSSSQDGITLPRRQTSAMSAMSRSKRCSGGSASILAFFRMSKPSA